MISKKEKILGWLLCIPKGEALATIEFWISELQNLRADGTHPSPGFVPVTAQSMALLTNDGREIIWVNGSAWALKPEIHAERLAEAMEQERKRYAAISKQQSQPTPPSKPQTACTALIDGQLCGGNLIRAAVCPRCALGKSGVTETLTCDVCGHVTAIMRGAK